MSHGQSPDPSADDQPTTDDRATPDDQGSVGDAIPKSFVTIAAATR